MFPETAERRVRASRAEVREKQGEAPMFCGRACVYNEWSDLLYGCFKERIAPGAFDKSLRENTDIICTVNHNFNYVLGRQGSKTLRLLPDDEGISVECEGSDYSYARNLVIAIKRGDIRGMSFVFDVGEDSWVREQDVPQRTVLRADIYEVSFVYHPAYPQTDATMRSGVSGKGEVRSRERASTLWTTPLLNLAKQKLRLEEALTND